MSQEQLIIDVLNGLVYLIVFCLIVMTLKLACASEQTSREGTEEANRIVFSKDGGEKEAEEIINEHFKEV